MPAQATLMERLMPWPDRREVHRIMVAADPSLVLAHAVATDPAGGPVAALLLRVRRPFARAGRSAIGFRALASSPTEVVSCLAGRFWAPDMGIVAVAGQDAFATFDQPGSARLLFGFRVEVRDGATLLTTETRVQGTDARGRRRLAAYWFVIRPFSGLIRRSLLRRIRASAEAERRSHSQRTSS